MHRWITMVTLLAPLPASAQDAAPPKRTIPPTVLVEVADLEGRFDLALAADCAADACFSKGCSYVAHTIADRPPAASLPGLENEPGPNPAGAQAWLTQARCEFAYEASLEPGFAQALSRRLQTKVSSGYTVVSVGAQALPDLPLPPEPIAPPEPAVLEEALPPAEPTLSDRLLASVEWVLALFLGTLTVITLLWAWRRVGVETIEERAMRVELERGPPPEPAAPPDGPDPAVTAAKAAWRLRLEAGGADPGLAAMLQDLLRAGELPLLAKAVLTFPDLLPRAFPSGGDLAAPKLQLAAFLKTADPSALPSDEALFAALDRHGSAAALAAQKDAEVVRSLREEFGVAGLVGLVERVAPRAGGLLFALAPPEVQLEAARLLPEDRIGSVADQLLRSNRMDAAETERLFTLVRAVRAGEAPPTEAPSEVSDRGRPFDAAAALSALLPGVSPQARRGLLTRALDRTGGTLPAWTHDVLVPDLLLALPDDARADLLLGTPIDELAAWLSLYPHTTSERVLAGAPGTLAAGVANAPAAATRAEQVARADAGRRALARGGHEQLARSRGTFEDLIRAMSGAPA